MPHVNLKIAAGRSDVVKHELAEAIADNLVRIAGANPAQISVAIEDVEPKNWANDVYDVEIAPKAECLYRRPGYDPEDLPR